MKKYFYSYITIALLVFSSCNEIDDVYAEIGESELAVLSEDYVLTEDDYSIFFSKTDADSMVAYNEMFDSYDQAERLIPEVLINGFPYAGTGSALNVDFEVQGGLEDISSYVYAEEYETTSDDLASFDESAGIAGFLSPSFDVESALSSILLSEVQDPEDGDILAVTYEYADEDPILDDSQAGLTTVYFEDFVTDLSGVTIIDVSGEDSFYWQQWVNGCATIAPVDGSFNPVANEDWIITPEIDLSDVTESSLKVVNVMNYLDGNPADFIHVYVSSDFTGDQTTATWTEFEVDAWPAGDSWSEEVTATMDISSFDGETINVALVLNTTTVLDGLTWEVGEITVEAVSAVSVEIPSDPYSKTEYFQYVEGDSEWEMVDGVYQLVAADYDAMGTSSGQPGRYDNFSSSVNPDEYLPTFLLDNYPYAEEEEELIVMYKYFDGSTVTRGDLYTFIGGVWSPSSAVIQFSYDGTDWIPDNTIAYALGGADWDAIAEAWEERNVAGSESVAQYGNFDVTLWTESQRFEAITERLLVIFPNTEEGQKYLISYATWEPGSSTRELYVIYENGAYSVYEE